MAPKKDPALTPIVKKPKKPRAAPSPRARGGVLRAVPADIAHQVFPHMSNRPAPGALEQIGHALRGAYHAVRDVPPFSHYAPDTSLGDPTFHPGTPAQQAARASSAAELATQARQNQLNPFGKQVAIDPFTKKKWTPITGSVKDPTSEAYNQLHNVVDYVAQGTPDTRLFSKGQGPFYAKDPSHLTNAEYDKLRKLAAKGNSIAQKILRQGRYQAKGYPTASQDIAKILQPFTNQITQTLPADAAAVQANTDTQLAQTTFPVALAQANQDLALEGIPGVTTMPTPNAGTQHYADQLQSIVNGLPTINTPGPLPGIPSISQAIAQMGTAAKQSDLAVPDEALLNALLTREQSQLVYGTTPVVPGITGAKPTAAAQVLSAEPDYIQQLIEQVTGGAGNSTALPQGTIAQLQQAAQQGDKSTPIADQSGGAPTGIY